MKMNNDSGTLQTEGSVSNPVLDLPLLNDTPLHSQFPWHRLLYRSIQFAGLDSTKRVRAALLGALEQTSGRVRRKFGELHQQTDMSHRRLASFIAFTREIVVNPRSVGAVCPSSSELARAMARELGKIDDGLVLELGAGTGSITQALLEQGIPPACLIAIERSPALVAHLRARFPGIRVIEGDATQLDQLLGSEAGKVQAVVSGLPLRSLPCPSVREIAHQVQQLLPGDGVFVQFTYDLRTPSFNWNTVLRKQRTQVIWKNLPPARVDTFVRQADVLMLPLAG